MDVANVRKPAHMRVPRFRPVTCLVPHSGWLPVEVYVRGAECPPVGDCRGWGCGVLSTPQWVTAVGGGVGCWVPPRGCLPWVGVWGAECPTVGACHGWGCWVLSAPQWVTAVGGVWGAECPPVGACRWVGVCGVRPTVGWPPAGCVRVLTCVSAVEPRQDALEERVCVALHRHQLLLKDLEERGARRGLHLSLRNMQHLLQPHAALSLTRAWARNRGDDDRGDDNRGDWGWNHGDDNHGDGTTGTITTGTITVGTGDGTTGTITTETEPQGR